MRSLIQNTINKLHRGEKAEENIQIWLGESEFRPEAIEFTPDLKKYIVSSEHLNDLYEKIGLWGVSLPVSHAMYILSSIPLADQERLHALNTAKYVIHYDDNMNGTFIWGLVSIDKPNVVVRWRHHISHTLERATESYVSRVGKNIGEDKLFQPFTNGHRIPVREPNSTNDIYYGEITPFGSKLKDKAKKDKKTEIQIAWWSLIATLISFILGFILFKYSAPDDSIRWISGVFDRLATTFSATTVVSFLSYLFYLYDLRRKQRIEWK